MRFFALWYFCSLLIIWTVLGHTVLGEANRVLRPDGIFVVTFSDRVITQKVVQGWMELDETKRVALIAEHGAYGDEN